jgi:cytochrome c556
MKQSSGKVALLVTLVLPLLACQQSAPPAAAVDDSPEGQAFQFRHSLMTAVGWKVARLRAMAMGEIPVDNAAAEKDARDVAALAGMMSEGFIPNSAVEGSRALPAIWTNFPDFQQKANDLQTAAAALADATRANGFEASKGMVQPVGQSCGGCHRPYRASEE